MIYNRPTSIQVKKDEYLKAFKSIEDAKEKFYNIGAGTWEHPCWSNIDLPAQTPEFAAIQAPCINHDLVKNKKLPLHSNTVEAFYTSHVVEHIPDFANKNLFKEAYRCLKSGGVFRISTGPCADMDWQAILREDKNWWYFYDKKFEESLLQQSKSMTVYDKWLFHLSTPNSVFSSSKSQNKYSSEEIKELINDNINSRDKLLNHLTKDVIFDIDAPGNHVCWWNYNKLKEYLTEAGFSNIYRSGYGQSQLWWMRDLRYFDQTYPQISVYVEAIK